MAVVRVQLGLIEHNGEPFFVLNEWVTRTDIGWQATVPDFARRIWEAGRLALPVGLPTIRVEEISAEPQDDTDRQFYEIGMQAERDRLFRRMRLATDNDMYALLWYIAFHAEYVEFLHTAFDKLGVGHG